MGAHRSTKDHREDLKLVRIIIEGAGRLATTLATVSAKLEDFTKPGTRAARIAASRARSIAPKRTGALAGTIRATGSKRVGRIEAGAGLRYARPVHWGAPARNQRARPFLSLAAQGSEPTWIRAYEDHVDESLTHAKGT